MPPPWSCMVAFNHREGKNIEWSSVTEQSAADHACSCDLQENKGVWAGSRPVSQVYSSGDWKEKERWWRESREYGQSLGAYWLNRDCQVARKPAAAGSAQFQSNSRGKSYRAPHMERRGLEVSVHMGSRGKWEKMYWAALRVEDMAAETCLEYQNGGGGKGRESGGTIIGKTGPVLTWSEQGVWLEKRQIYYLSQKKSCHSHPASKRGFWEWTFSRMIWKEVWIVREKGSF